MRVLLGLICLSLLFLVHDNKLLVLQTFLLKGVASWIQLCILSRWNIDRDERSVMQSRRRRIDWVVGPRGIGEWAGRTFQMFAEEIERERCIHISKNEYCRVIILYLSVYTGSYTVAIQHIAWWWIMTGIMAV